MPESKLWFGTSDDHQGNLSQQDPEEDEVPSSEEGENEYELGRADDVS